MKSILVIGIGRFGRHLARKLASLDNEVMIVDRDEERMGDLIPEVTSAQIGDCTKREVLQSLGIRNFDICFVCIGDNFQSSLEITSLVKEMGAKYVISKANRDIHAKFLLRNGADEVVYPERYIAEKLAMRCSANHVFDYIELTDEYSIYEIPPLPMWLGKSINELDIRRKYRISILATKEAGGEMKPLPSADHIFRQDEHLMVLGSRDDVQKVLRKL